MENSICEFLCSCLKPNRQVPLKQDEAVRGNILISSEKNGFKVSSFLISISENRAKVCKYSRCSVLGSDINV